MPKPFVIILLCITLLSCQKQEKINDSRYRIVFKDWTWATIDLKSKVLKVDCDSLKYIDTLEFTASEDQELSKAFNNSGLSDVKGDIYYYPDVSDMPTFHQTIKIYKNDKLISNIEVNTKCKAGIIPFGSRYQAIRFRDIIVRILKKNKRFIDAEKRYRQYASSHGIFYL